MKEITEYDSKFNVAFNYNTINDVQLENIEWTVRVSYQKQITIMIKWFLSIN
jgi:hypothetical protein